MSSLILIVLGYFIYRNVLNMTLYGPISEWSQWEYIQIILTVIMVLFFFATIYTLYQEIREKITAVKKKQNEPAPEEPDAEAALDYSGLEVLPDGTVVEEITSLNTEMIQEAGIQETAESE